MNRSTLLKYAILLIFVAGSSAVHAQNIQPKLNIIKFDVVKLENRVGIFWATDNKIPTNYFEVEKSKDGKNFKTISYLLGADPTKPNCDCYESFDKNFSINKSTYYRLKHTNASGEVEYSEVKLFAINK